VSDDGKFGKAIRGQRVREVMAARERVLRGEGHPGEHAEEVTLADEVDGVPERVIELEIGAGWVPDAPEDHAGEN
jgi:hypothetical protein